ncbi:MAG: hypothetical protein PVF58_21385 [Candidatus Methanofastidiosia archaeon]|jgi:hypothetical protein
MRPKEEFIELNTEKKLPEIIKGYKTNKVRYSKEELRNTENYYKQKLLFEKLLKMIEEVKSI